VDTFDVVVIGAGPGGYPAAIRAAQLGARVAIIEKEELGGTCLNWGCIPTKALIASGELAAAARHAAEMGVRIPTVTPDYAAMIARKDQIVAKLRGGIKQLLAANGVKLFQGLASFEGRNRLLVSGPGGAATPLGAAKTILATGSTSAMPGFLPKHPRVVESRAFLELKVLPASVMVMGGGIIGCEFACLLAQLGVKVTVVEMLEDILNVVDADVRREVRRQMETSLSIRVLCGKPLENVSADDRGVRGSFGPEQVEAELLLVAVGRRPVTEGLMLANAGIQANKQGCIEVDECLQTSAPGVFAVGDVTPTLQLAHNATSQGLIAAENAVSKRLRKREALVPSCIFTSPEVGAVGLTEEEAKKQGREVRTGKFMFGALGKALAAGHTAGFVKWVADPGTDQLLGAQAVGPHATELIAEATLAVRAEVTARELGRTMHSHPTMSEAWMEATHALHGEAIHAAPRRKPK
jgi:dihydrolipoamide dehydrogenase